jgi:uncharacterized protein YdiU (UPF0061 family)
MLLNNEKYESVSKVLLSINNIYELAKFEKRIIIFNDDISDNEFKEKIENYSKELNENTIDLIRERLGYDKESNTTKISNENIIKDELKKILCPENSNKIIKF